MADSRAQTLCVAQCGEDVQFVVDVVPSAAIICAGWNLAVPPHDSIADGFANVALFTSGQMNDSVAR